MGVIPKYTVFIGQGTSSPTSSDTRSKKASIIRLIDVILLKLDACSFQHVKLVENMSVIENVALGSHLRGHALPLQSILRLGRAEKSPLRRGRLSESDSELIRNDLAV